MSQKNVLNENKEPASADAEKTQNETPPEFQGKDEQERRHSDLHSDTISEDQARERNASAVGAAAPAATNAGEGRPDIVNTSPDTSGSIDRGAINADAAGVPADASQDHRSEEEKQRDINQENYESRNADVDPNSPVQPGSKQQNNTDDSQQQYDAQRQDAQQANDGESADDADDYSPEYDGNGPRPSEQQDSSESSEENKNQ